VIILDKKPKDRIGDKNCGDALDGKHSGILYDEMGIEPPSVEIGEARDLISTITIAAGSLSSKFSAAVPGHQVDRLVYGQRLLRQAEKEGVEIRAESPVRGLLWKGDQVIGVTYYDREGQKHNIRGKITIDASGFVGNVRKHIPKDISRDVELSFQKEWTIGTYREIIELDWDHDHDFREEIVILYHDKIPPPGYAWIFSEGEKKLNLGVTWVKSDPYPDGKSMKDIYHEILDEYIDPTTYTVIDKGGGNIPMRPNFDTLVFHGGMIVGDAGGLADPTTFEGHGPALESGRLASITAIKALEKDSFRDTDLWSYNKAIMDYPGGMHAQSFLASRLLREIGVENLQFLLDKKIIDEQELDDIFRNNKGFPLWLKLKKFFMAFPKWGLMLKLKSRIDRIERAGEIYKQYPSVPEGLD
jgi:flavin-dependent dehydrogenase